MAPLPELVRIPSFLLRSALLTAVVALAACGGAPDGADGAAAGGPPGGFAVPVEIVTLAEQPVARSSDFVATIKSRRSTTIQPQVEGFLTDLRVTSGQRVTPGTVLFEIDSATQRAVVATLRSQRSARAADATLARQTADRVRRLVDAGAASQQELEQAEAQATATESQLGTIDEQIRQAETELAYYQVVAPTAGRVGDVPVRKGDRVTRSTVLTTLEDNAGLEVYVQVPVQQAPDLRVGLPVQLLSQTGEILATERLSFIASSVDESTQTVLAKAAVTRQSDQLRADQFVRVRLIWSEQPGLLVPLVSVLRVSGQQFVYVAEPGDGGALVAHLRSVQLGPVIGNDYLVLGGVSAGDRLITSGIQKIGDGAPVQAAPPPGAGGAPPEGGRGGGE